MKLSDLTGAEVLCHLLFLFPFLNVQPQFCFHRQFRYERMKCIVLDFLTENKGYCCKMRPVCLPPSAPPPTAAAADDVEEEDDAEEEAGAKAKKVEERSL